MSRLAFLVLGSDAGSPHNSPPRLSTRARTDSARRRMAYEPSLRSSGMVGKKELLGWVSDTCGRSVESFSQLKDGDALVRCVEETWPLAYDEVRPRFPKRMDGTRDPKQNFELVKAVFASIRLPPAALDVRGVRASAFRPATAMVMCSSIFRSLRW